MSAFVAPAFLVMVAMLHKPGSPTAVQELQTMITTEGFTQQDGKEMAGLAERVRVVYGLNCFCSSAVGADSFDGLVQGTFGQGARVGFDVFGFTWTVVVDKKKKYYSFPTANTGALGESPCASPPERLAIPMRGVRETIKNHQRSRAFVAELEKKKAPIYIVTMDSDARSLAPRSEAGIFVQFHNSIKEYFEEFGTYPSAVTGGFQIDDPRYPLVRLATEMEMHVRSAVTKEGLPFATFYPEPASAFLLPVKEKADERLRALKFLEGDLNNPHTDDGGSENIHLVRFGTESGNLERTAVFKFPGGVLTTTPPRTIAAADGWSSPSLSVQSALANMIELPQMQVKPSLMAKGIYGGLRVQGVGELEKASFDQAMQAITKIFCAFDPISRLLGTEVSLADQMKGKPGPTWLLAEDYEQAMGETVPAMTETLLLQGQEELLAVLEDRDDAGDLVQAVINTAQAAANVLKQFLIQNIDGNKSLGYSFVNPYAAALEEMHHHTQPQHLNRHGKHAHHKLRSRLLFV